MTKGKGKILGFGDGCTRVPTKLEIWAKFVHIDASGRNLYFVGTNHHLYTAGNNRLGQVCNGEVSKDDSLCPLTKIDFTLDFSMMKRRNLMQYLGLLCDVIVICEYE